jgi:hypothetical protein
MLNDCPGFDDDVLRAVGGKRLPGLDGERAYALEDDLQSFFILDLMNGQNITVDALKDMIEMRSLRNKDDPGIRPLKKTRLSAVVLPSH